MGAAADREALHPETAGEDEQRLADAGGFEAEILAVLDMGERVAELLVIGADHEAIHASRSVERVLAGVDPGPGEARRHHSGLGGEAGVERLRHRAELAHEAGRHAGRDRDRVGRRLGVERQQPRAGGGGTDRADRRGGVPAAVAVGRVHALADPAENLQAGDIGVEALPARRALGLGQREDGGGQDGGGVRLGRIEIVVEIERMGGGAVDQSGPGRGQPGGLQDRGRRAGAPVRTVSSTASVAGSTAPAMVTPSTSINWRWADSSAASGQASGVSASQAP